MGLEPATSHFSFVGDRITRGHIIQPRHLECRTCSCCLYKGHSEWQIGNFDQARAKLRRACVCCPDFSSADGFHFSDLHFSQENGPWACWSFHQVCLSVVSAVCWVLEFSFVIITKLEVHRQIMATKLKTAILTLK